MLQTVTRPDKLQVHFTYDALGRRLSKTFKSTTTKWLWDGNVPLHEWKENQNGDILSNSTVGDNGIVTWVFEDYQVLRKSPVDFFNEDTAGALASTNSKT
ncbi:hypothetical protein [Lacinutrix sp. MEBiC02595]